MRLAVLLLLCTSCGASALRTEHATARSAVLIATDAWEIAARICVDTSQTAADDGIRVSCAKVLLPAHDLLVSAAGAVDTHWSPKAACDLTQAVALIDQSIASLPHSTSVQSVFDDARIVAAGISASAGCTP